MNSPDRPSETLSRTPSASNKREVITRQTRPPLITQDSGPLPDAGGDGDTRISPDQPAEQPAGRYTPLFGNADNHYSTPLFGSADNHYTTPLFGHVHSDQSAPLFGDADNDDSAPLFGDADNDDSTPLFGRPDVD